MNGDDTTDAVAEAVRRLKPREFATSFICCFALCERRDNHDHEDFALLDLYRDKVNAQADRIDNLEAMLAKVTRDREDAWKQRCEAVDIRCAAESVLDAQKRALDAVRDVCDSQKPRHFYESPQRCDYHCPQQIICEVEAALALAEQADDVASIVVNK